MSTINDFKAKLTGGGARPNLFKVICNFPAGITADTEEASFLIKAASLPSSVISPIEVPWRGKKLRIPGDRDFEAWTITVINNVSFNLRNAFEQWSNFINNHREVAGSVNISDYEADMIVQQLNKNDEVIKEYTLRGCWPSNLGAIELSNDSENTLEEFTVELQMSYWESVGITS